MGLRRLLGSMAPLGKPLIRTHCDRCDGVGSFANSYVRVDPSTTVLPVNSAAMPLTSPFLQSLLFGESCCSLRVETLSSKT